VVLLLLAFAAVSQLGAADQYFDGSTTNALTASKWGTSNAGPFTSAFTSGNTAVFATVNGTGSGAGGITVGGIRAEQNFTYSSPSGTLSTGGTVAAINVFANMKLDLGGIALSTAAGTGFNKTGTGTLVITSGGSYTGGFTLTAGTMVAGGVNAMGASGALNLNGGILTVNSSTARDFTGKYTGGITVGGDVQFGDSVKQSVGTGNMTFSNNMGLGAATRTLTLGYKGNVTFGGIISGASGSGLTFNATSGNDSTAASNGTFAITGTANTFTGTININGPEVTFAADGSFGNTANTVNIDGGRLTTTANLTLTAGRGIQVGSTAGTSISAKSGTTLTYNGVIADKSGATGAWAKQGSGTLALGGISTYTGNTAINNGTLQLTTGTNRLPTGTTVSLGQSASTNLGTFDLNAFSQEIAGLNSTTGTNAGASKNTVTSATAATLTLGGSGTYSYGDGTAANSGIIAGALTLTKSGSGTQTLGDINTYTGGTNINGGILSIGNAAALGSSGTISFGGGALQYSGITTDLSSRFSSAASQQYKVDTNTQNVTWGTALTSSGGSLTKSGAGTLILSAANTYSGGTNLSAGILSITDSSNIGSGAFNITGLATQLTVTGTAATFANNFTLPSATGQFTFLTPNNSSTVINGTISGGNANIDATTRGGTEWFFQGGASGQNTGALTLNGNNSTMQGTINVQRGPLILGNANAAGTTVIRLDSNNNASGALQLSASINVANKIYLNSGASQNIGVGGALVGELSGAISSTGAFGIAKVGTGTLVLSGANTYAGTTTVSAGSLLASGGSAIPDTSAVTLANTAGVGLQLNNNETVASIAGGGTTGGTIELGGNTLSLAGTASTSFAGVINGNGGSITKTAASTGTLTLSGTNTYTGGTNLNGGALSISNGGALGTGALNVNLSAGATFLTVTNTASTDVGNAIALPTPGTAQLYVISKSAASSSTGTQLNLTGTISGGNANTTLRFTSGTTSDNTTTYRLNGNNTFSGIIELFRGAIVITNNNSLGNATLNLNGNNNTSLGDLRFENSVTLANNIALVNNSNPDPINTNGNTATLNGIVSSTGSAGLVKIGSGTLLLGGTNTYTVSTAINEGTVKVTTIAANGTAQPLGQATSAITLGGSSTTGTFEYSGATASLGRDFTVSSSTGSAGVIKNSGGGALTLAGTLTKDGKVLTLTGGAFTVSGKITGATANSDLVVDAATVTLTNTTNDYNGPTIIQNSGKVIMAGDYLGIVPASTTAGNVVLNNGTLNTTADVTLDTKRGLLIGPASGTGTGTLQADTGTTLTVNGVLANNSSGTGSLTKAGAGNVTLTAANTYSGGTSVTAGTLQLGTSGTTGDASTGDIDVATGTTLKTSRSNTLTLGQAITGAGNVDVSNTSAGTTVLSKATGNTYSGTTTVNSGTLLANNTSGTATGTSKVSVNGATAVLGGTGTIGGATTVTLGQITPGTAALTGKLTFGNSVTLDGTSAGTRLSLRLGASGASDLNDAANIQSHFNDNTYMTWILTQATAYELTTGGTHDRLSVDTLNLSSGGQIVVDNTAGYSPQFGDVFNLLDWTTFNKNTFNLGTDANNQRAGGLSGDLNLPGLASGLSYDLTLFNASGASGIVIVVPEPSRALLVVLGVVSMMLRRRRR
jgi:autotransporter-associated beta strand protein